jgi:hypothetical protein
LVSSNISLTAFRPMPGWSDPNIAQAQPSL